MKSTAARTLLPVPNTPVWGFLPAHHNYLIYLIYSDYLTYSDNSNYSNSLNQANYLNQGKLCFPQLREAERKRGDEAISNYLNYNAYNQGNADNGYIGPQKSPACPTSPVCPASPQSPSSPQSPRSLTSPTGLVVQRVQQFGNWALGLRQELGREVFHGH